MTTDTNEIIAVIARIRERANLLIAEELKKRRIKAIVPAHGAILAFLFSQDQPVPIKAIVGRVDRVKSTVTEMLNTLERHGFIRKTPSNADNRVTEVSLTDKGRKLRADFEAISATLRATAYESMPKRDRQTLLSLLSQIEGNFKSFNGGA